MIVTETPWSLLQVDTVFTLIEFGALPPIPCYVSRACYDKLKNPETGAVVEIASINCRNSPWITCVYAFREINLALCLIAGDPHIPFLETLDVTRNIFVGPLNRSAQFFHPGMSNGPSLAKMVAAGMAKVTLNEQLQCKLERSYFDEVVGHCIQLGIDSIAIRHVEQTPAYIRWISGVEHAIAA